MCFQRPAAIITRTTRAVVHQALSKQQQRWSGCVRFAVENWPYLVIEFEYSGLFDIRMAASTSPFDRASRSNTALEDAKTNESIPGLNTGISTDLVLLKIQWIHSTLGKISRIKCRRRWCQHGEIFYTALQIHSGDSRFFFFYKFTWEILNLKKAIFHFSKIIKVNFQVYGDVGVRTPKIVYFNCPLDSSTSKIIPKKTSWISS